MQSINKYSVHTHSRSIHSENEHTLIEEEKESGRMMNRAYGVGGAEEKKK